LSNFSASLNSEIRSCLIIPSKQMKDSCSHGTAIRSRSIVFRFVPSSYRSSPAHSPKFV